MSWIKADTPKEQKHFNYLEELRQTGATNMWGAAPWLQNAFPRHFQGRDGTARSVAILSKWIKAHSDPDRVLKNRP